MATTWTYSISGTPGDTTTPPQIALGSLTSRLVLADVTSYTTGGETLTPRDFGMHEILFVSAISNELNLNARLNQARTRLILFDAAGAEVTAAADGGRWFLWIIGVRGY